jgi:hypothetical protein
MEGGGSAGNLPGKSSSQVAALSLTDMQTEAAASNSTNTSEEALSTNRQPNPLLILANLVYLQLTHILLLLCQLRFTQLALGPGFTPLPPAPRLALLPCQHRLTPLPSQPLVPTCLVFAMQAALSSFYCFNKQPSQPVIQGHVVVIYTRQGLADHA